MTFSSPVQRVAIIGAGAVGLTCIKYLLAEKAFETIDVFEQRSVVGGIWNWSPPTERLKTIPVPQEDPQYGATLQKKNTMTQNGSSPGHEAIVFESPLYDDLEANIPKESMQYSDQPFPDECPLYPSHQETLEYLVRYAEDVKHVIQFETQVQDVKLIDEVAGSLKAKWEITSCNLQNGRLSQSVYDAVIVASGHYDVPRIVNILGVDEWSKAYPGAVIHSKAYRTPELFKDQRVLVIGNSASGTDIAFHVGRVCSMVYLSSRTVSSFWSGTGVDWKEDIDEVVEFLPPTNYNRAVRTKSGKVVDNLDSVIFATGYFYSFPFLSVQPPVITDGLRVRDTYKDLIHIEHPSLMFPVISNKILPFELAEHQAAVIARLWSGRLQVPSKEEMRQWEKMQLELKGTGKQYHLKAFPEELALMNDAYSWAASAPLKADLANGGVGKLGVPWDPPRVWLRSSFIALKMAYIEKGEERRSIFVKEELGFDYGAWRQNATPKELEMFTKARCPSLMRFESAGSAVNGVL